MGLCPWKKLFVFLFIFSTFLAYHQHLLAAAMRPLEGEQWLKKDGHLGLAFQSLQRAPVPPVGSGNPCTNIPGRSSGTCTLNGMNIAGSVRERLRSFPIGRGSGDASTRVVIDNEIHEA